MTFDKGDFLECEVAFEEAQVRSVSLVAGKVLSASLTGTSGMSIQLCFIGSNDRAIADEFPTTSEINIHLCRYTVRQTECKVTTDGFLHSTRFRKLSLSEMRALSYIPKSILDEHIPPPPSSKAASLRGALSRKPAGTPDPKRMKPEGALPNRGDLSPAHLFNNLEQLAQGIRTPRQRVPLTSGDEEEAEDRDIHAHQKAGAAEIHRERPGQLGFDMIWSVTKKQTAKEGFMPCIHEYAAGIVKLMGKDSEKHKAACRELLTLARAIDCIADQLIYCEKNGMTGDFSRKNPMKDLWMALDIMGQRWLALEYVMGLQAKQPELSTAKMWESLTTFELEPPFAETIAGTALLQRSVNDALRQEKLFSKLKNTK